jgi:hypothetical protein
LAADRTTRSVRPESADNGTRRYRRLLGSLARLALRRPSLVLPLLAAAWRFRRRDWYRTPPFLPLPPQDYIAWRLHTAYGEETIIPPARELARYLRWASRVRKRPGPGRRHVP